MEGFVYKVKSISLITHSENILYTQSKDRCERKSELYNPTNFTKSSQTMNKRELNGLPSCTGHWYSKLPLGFKPTLLMVLCHIRKKEIT